MTPFALIIACYCSGQMTEAQWQAHLTDRAFAAWVAAQESA